MRRLGGTRMVRVGIAAAVCALLTIAGRPSGAVSAEPATVTGVTTRTEGRELQVVIRASAPVRYQVQPVRPDWIVVDILNARLGLPAGTAHAAEGVIRRIRVGQFTPDVVRVVVECATPARFHVAAADDENAVIVAIPEAVQKPAVGAPAAPPEQPGGAMLVVPGRSIGSIRLGMKVQDVVAVLGPAKETAARPGVGTDYTWYAAPAGSGLGVRATDGGVVRQIWVLNDGAYRTREGLHAGSAEADVSAALGAPSWTVAVTSQEKATTLMYDALGVWFGIRPSPTASDRNVVFRIDVMEPSSTGPPRTGP